MEDSVKLTLAILCAASLMVAACQRNEPRKTQAASENRADMQDQMKAERDNYVKSVDARLSEIDKKIDGLDERAGAMTGAAKTDFNTAIDSLRDERKQVASKVDDLKGVTIDSWTTMKGEVDAAMASLDRSYDQISAKFENMSGQARPKAVR
jgi:hypothetical protein